MVKERPLYIVYNDPEEVEALDLNTVKDPSKIVVFPRHIYGGEVFPAAEYVCSRPRDTETHYVYDRERLHHPQHFSRFGYGRCQYGYCTGPASLGYQANIFCQNDVQPKNMAPDYLYPGNVDNFGPYLSQANVNAYKGNCFWNSAAVQETPCAKNK